MENIAKPPLTGRHVFFAFVAFFALIVAVNTVFIKTALTTYSGVITDKPYEKGLAYNATLQQAKAQQNINSTFDYDDGQMILQLTDASGKAIKSADVTARFVWPVKAGHDFEASLKPAQQDGTYSATLTPPLKGQWHIYMTAQWDTQQYKNRYTIMVK